MNSTADVSVSKAVTRQPTHVSDVTRQQTQINAVGKKKTSVVSNGGRSSGGTGNHTNGNHGNVNHSTGNSSGNANGGKGISISDANSAASRLALLGTPSGPQDASNFAVREFRSCKGNDTRPLQFVVREFRSCKGNECRIEFLFPSTIKLNDWIQIYLIH
jgi:hypothetical protein